MLLIVPQSVARIWSAFRIVLSLWAIMITVFIFLLTKCQNKNPADHRAVGFSMFSVLAQRLLNCHYLSGDRQALQKHQGHLLVHELSVSIPT